MNYNFYLFSNLAEVKCQDIKDISEYDYKFDKLVELYEEYNKSSYPTNINLSDYDAMCLFFNDREDIKNIQKFKTEIAELKWRISCMNDDANVINNLLHNRNNIDVKEMIKSRFFNIEIAANLKDRECFRWLVNNKSFFDK